MSQTFVRKLLLAAVVAVSGMVVAGSPISIGQEKEKQESKEKKKGKLPAYYADIVSEAQRQQIYAVQEKYSKTLAALQEQIDTIQKQRDTEIEALLDAQQKVKLNLAREEAAAKKAKATAEKKAAEAKAAAEKGK